MVQTIVVCGAGTMGSGIAQTAAMNGFYTVVYDLTDNQIDKSKAAIEKNLSALVEKQKLTADQKHNTLQRIRFVTDINLCIGDLVIEAILETMEAKLSLFNQLAEVNHSETIFATNTSSLSVTEMARQLPHPERICGMHFFNPATLMKLVEVVHTPLTNETVTKTVAEVAVKMGKTPVTCTDAPGFIVNHVARPFYIEALRLVETCAGEIPVIDEVMEASGFKMGPFRLMDLIGNDINYTVSCSVYDALGKPDRLQPSPIQQSKVANQELGRKTGKGYYSYT